MGARSARRTGAAFSIRSTLRRCSPLVCHGSVVDLVVSFVGTSSSLVGSVVLGLLVVGEMPHLPLALPLAFPGGVAVLPARPVFLGFVQPLQRKRVAKFVVSQFVHVHSGSFAWGLNARFASNAVRISWTKVFEESL